MPFNLDEPYLHDGVYTKDFFLTFSAGDVSNIRQAYLSVSNEALPLNQLEKGHHGILHGSQHGQEVHAVSAESIQPSDKLWLTLQTWKGEVFVTSWDIPKELVK